MTKPRPQLAAVRTISETDDVRIIEGLGIPFGGPFGGRDSYGTYASVRTDFVWDLFPDVLPSATRAAEDAPRFIRPVTYNHGFDQEIGLSRLGGWSPVRMDADGVWVQAQIDKRQKYYARVGELLDKDQLGFSSDSAEHSVRIDQHTGEWLEWPAYGLALTPTESNPYAVVAARSAETIRIIDQLAGKPTPAATPSAVRGIQTFNDIVAGMEMDEELPEAFSTLQSAIYSAIWAVDADFNAVPTDEKRAAIQTSLDQFRDYVLGIMDKAARTAQPALRSLRHAAQPAVGQPTGAAIPEATEALDATAPINSTVTADDGSARSAEASPTLRVIAAPEKADAETLRDLAVRLAGPVGESVARKMLDLKT